MKEWGIFGNMMPRVDGNGFAHVHGLPDGTLVMIYYDLGMKLKAIENVTRFGEELEDETVEIMDSYNAGR